MTGLRAEPRVVATAAAQRAVAALVAERGPVMFFQSGGCCDGSLPMCFAEGEFRLGGRDVHLGDVAGAPFYIDGRQFERWAHTQLIVDVVPGRGGMFSLDGPEGLRFLTRSRLYTEEDSLELSQQDQEPSPS